MQFDDLRRFDCKGSAVPELHQAGHARGRWRACGEVLEDLHKLLLHRGRQSMEQRDMSPQAIAFRRVVGAAQAIGP
ncbi:uncharacterized protein PY1_contig-02-85 [Novosphingobium sp. PY1]|nr:uncharacterized protein PY1_contig-02-85 [Novosphingobium sp. PY1]